MVAPHRAAPRRRQADKEDKSRPVEGAAVVICIAPSVVAVLSGGVGYAIGHSHGRDAGSRDYYADIETICQGMR